MPRADWVTSAATGIIEADHEAVWCHESVEPICFITRLTTTRRPTQQERHHEQPRPHHAHRSRCGPRSHIEAAAFLDLLFGRSYRRHARLVGRARLGCDHACALVVLLISSDIRRAGWPSQP